MAKITVAITGDKELNRKLKKLGKDSKKAVRKATRPALRPVLEESKKQCPGENWEPETKYQDPSITTLAPMGWIEGNSPTWQRSKPVLWLVSGKGNQARDQSEIVHAPSGQQQASTGHGNL